MFLTPQRSQMFPFSRRAISPCGGFSKPAVQLEGSHVAECLNTSSFLLSNSTGPVFRQTTRSWRAAGPQQQPETGQQDQSLGRGEGFHPAASSHRGRGSPLPAHQSLPDSLKMMCRVFSHTEAIYRYFLGTAVGFVLLIILLMKCLFACVIVFCGRSLQFIMLVLTLLHLQPKHKQRLHRNLAGG